MADLRPETQGAKVRRLPAQLSDDPPDMHPYRVAWETRDLDAWAQALAPDVVMYSPVLRAPFVGREVAVELFGVLFEAFEHFEFTGEFVESNSHVFFWRARYRDQIIEGADLVASDELGRISEITVLIRPLVNIAAFAAAIGGPLAARRGRVRSLLVRSFNLPLKLLFTLVDLVASRLIQRR